MAVILTDDRTVIDPADGLIGWTGSVTISTITADPIPVEATGCIGQRNNNTTTDCYFTISATDMSNQLVYVWLYPRTVTDTKANGGMAIQLGDGTNRVAYHLAGDDVAAFRHEQGPTMWQCLVLDTTKLASYSATVKAGSRATLEGNLANITQIGYQFKATVGAQGNTPNTYGDIMRRGAAGVGISITGGSSGDKGTFEQISVADRSIADLKAHGVLRKLGAGAFGAQGSLTFGEASGSSSSWFEEKNTVLVFEDRGLGTDKYVFKLVDNGTGTTTFKLGTKVGTAGGKDGVSIIVPAGVGGLFDSSDTDLTDVFVYGSRISGFENGVLLKSGLEYIGCLFDGCGQITVSGALLLGSQVVGSVAASALRWDTNEDPDGNLDGVSFVSGGAGHGITFGTNTPGDPSEISLRDVLFTGYGADGTTDAAVFNDSGKHLIINILGSGSTPTVRNGSGASTTVVSGQKTLTLTGLQAGSEVRIYDAGTTTERAGIESSGTTFAYSYTFVADDFVDIVVLHLNKLYFRIDDFELASTDASLPIAQQVDRQYANP